MSLTADDSTRQHVADQDDAIRPPLIGQCSPTRHLWADPIGDGVTAPSCVCGQFRVVECQCPCGDMHQRLIHTIGTPVHA